MKTCPIGLRPAVDRDTGVIRVGADDGTRTRNRRFTKPLLYQLSYVGAQNHTAGGPVAPGDDRAQRPNGSSGPVLYPGFRTQGFRARAIAARGRVVPIDRRPRLASQGIVHLLHGLDELDRTSLPADRAPVCTRCRQDRSRTWALGRSLVLATSGIFSPRLASRLQARSGGLAASPTRS
jgi:hypothetical protein